MKDELIMESLKTIKGLVIDLAYSENSEDDFVTIVAINDVLKVIEDSVAAIESDRDRQNKLASIMRKRLGEQLDDLCDTLGVN